MEPVQYGVKKDSFGIPWDDRIHVLSKNKTPVGQWKVKRNFDPEYLNQIKTLLFKYWNE